jgi:hypothetical protein
LLGESESSTHTVDENGYAHQGEDEDDEWVAEQLHHCVHAISTASASSRVAQ